LANHVSTTRRHGQGLGVVLDGARSLRAADERDHVAAPVLVGVLVVEHLNRRGPAGLRGEHALEAAADLGLIGVVGAVGGERRPELGPVEHQLGLDIGGIRAADFVEDTQAVDGLGVFDEVSGPDPANVETQLVLDGSELGATLTADCPDDADQTEVGGSFECVLTTEAGGTATIEVLNNENTYEYRRRDVVALVSRAE